MTAVEATTRRRMIGWVKDHVPTPAKIERSRWLRPIAHRILVPSLWRFNRRSMPRGVALGLLTGILFPFAHAPLAALLALPTRANVPVAVSTTFLNNPLTFGPILYAAYRIGQSALRLDAAMPGQPLATQVHGHVGMLHWIAAGGPPIIVGLVILAGTTATAGYALTAAVWRLRMARKWRHRRRVNRGP